MKKILSSKIVQRIKSFVIAHKIWSALIIIAVFFIGHYIFSNNTSTETRYVMSTVTKGTVITSVTGSGQVSVVNQIDIKPKVSGDVLSVSVTNGQKVKAGTLIAKLDTTDAEKNVRDAELNLAQAQLALEKLQQPADTLSLMQAQSAVTQAQSDLVKAHDDGFTAVSNAFLDLPNIMTGTHDILYLNDLVSGGSQQNVSYYADAARQFDTVGGVSKAEGYMNDVNQKYQLAQTAYTTAFNLYKSTSRYSDPDKIEALVDQTYSTTKTIADAIKSAMNLIQYYQDTVNNQNLIPIAKSTVHLTSLSNYTTKITSDLSNLLTIQNTIINANTNVPEKQQALSDLQAGTTDIDLKTAELSLQQRQNALLDAKQTLNDYYITAPFDGTITGLTVGKLDSASSGSAIATLITDQKIAKIPLNEVDVAKISLGQKVTLTFDAISDLSIAGVVSEIDSVGTVSQGVVTYNVQITFNTQDDRVKDGMSVTAAIITNISQDVLTVPNSAIKTKNGVSYVEIFDTPLPAPAMGIVGSPSSVAPKQQIVTTGLASDSITEITSGLKEGDQVVSRTVTATAAAKTASSAPSLLGGNSLGATRGGK